MQKFMNYYVVLGQIHEFTWISIKGVSKSDNICIDRSEPGLIYCCLDFATAVGHN